MRSWSALLVVTAKRQSTGRASCKDPRQCDLIPVTPVDWPRSLAQHYLIPTMGSLLPRPRPQINFLELT